jgi:hypothetical protein
MALGRVLLVSSPSAAWRNPLPAVHQLSVQAGLLLPVRSPYRGAYARLAMRSVMKPQVSATILTDLESRCVWARAAD